MAESNTSREEACQTSPYLWYLRFIQILFALIIIGVTGSNISDWHGLGCDSPSRLSFNFAIAFLSLLLIIYFLFSTGPYVKLHFWSFYGQLALDALFVIFWIAAASMASYDCNNVCKVCSVPGAQYDQGYGFIVWVHSLVCACVFPDDYNYKKSKRLNSPEEIFRRARIPVSSESDLGQNLKTVLEKSVSTTAKRGLDATMILLFMFSLAGLLVVRYSSKGDANAQAEGIERADQVHGNVGDNFNLGDTGPAVDSMV